MPRPEHAIARVLGRTRPVGLAFLVRDRELLTCAHVVNTALGRPKEATDPALGAPLEIEFVFADGGRRRGAVVAGWLPTPGAFSQRDAAVLRLSETAPAELPRLRLADADAGGAGGDVQVFGPSPERRTAGHVRAQLLGAVDDARLQLDQHIRGVFRVAPGFSGGPAWRPDTGAVAGMVQAAATDADATDAYALGVPVLVAALHSAAPAAPRASPPTGPLTVVHLAAPRCAAGGAEAAGPLVADLVRLGERHELAPDLVTVAGDLVERATPADYEAAYAFLDAVAAGLGLGRDRVVVVPGDHDVNRKKCHAHFLSQEAEDEKPVPPYWPKWSPFAGFVGTFLGREFPRDEPWLLADFPDLNLCVAALNSTIAQSHLPGDDYGWLGDEQLRRFADQLAAAPRHDWLRLGLVHHRPTGGGPARAALRDADRFADVLGPHLHAVLHGRAGARRLEPLAGHGVPVLGPLTGAPPARPRGYQVIRLTGRGLAGEGLAGQGPVREELAVWARRYDEDRQRWLGDTGVSDDGDDWVRRVPARWRGAPARFPAPPGGDAAAADSGEAAGDTVGLADRGLVDRGRADRGRADQTDADPPDLLARVAEVCRLRAPDASVNEVREPTGRAGYLRLTRNLAVDPGARAVTESYPVAVHQGTPDWSDIERFQAVDALFRSGGAAVGSKLVYDGPPVAAELRERARLRGIELLSFAEFQLGYDLRPYARRQAERLAADPVYPPALYVPQRYHAIGDDGGGGDLLTDVRGWLADPDGHFVLVLGEFGHGKTFLLHELARRMHAEGDPAVPVLVHLRDLEKTHQLDELVAAQLTRGGQRRIDLAMFRYLLENGRIALLFDGYDELALRVTYDRAAEHLRTIVEAAGGRAKVVLTSRDQYFLTDAQVTSALGAQIAVLAGRRIVRVDGFDENQVLSFLTRRLGDGAAAARRLGLLRDVRDLLGLSRNPRMLGFIAAIDEGRLLAARDSTGEMTAAALYRELIDQWLHQEEHRLSAGGGPPGPSAGRLWEAVRGLAVRLWATPGGQLGLADLAETADALAALAPPAEEAAASRDETTQILGSATLLVRDAEGNFRFVHRSVLEWLVADACAARLRAGEDHPAALDRPMSALMADFLIALAGSNRALRWATGVLARGSDGTAATDNAILVSRRLGATTEAAQLAGRDLRGRDLTGQNLRGADLAGADLREATLVGADLTGADLTGANLARARLLGARLVAAVLRGADLTGAGLHRADLTRADLTGARLRRAALVGAAVSNAALAAADTAGAAPPTGGVVTRHLRPPRTTSRAVAYSPDGGLLAEGRADGGIMLWEAATGAPIRQLLRHAGGVRAVAWGPDGTALASAGEDGAVRLWDPAAGLTTRVLAGHGAPVWAIAWSPDGTALAAADGTVRLWDLATGSARRLPGTGAPVWAIAWSPDGTALATAGDDGTVWLRDPATGDTSRVLAGHTRTVWAVAWSPDGSALASGGANREVRVWDPATGDTTHVLSGHTRTVLAVAWAPDGVLLATAGADSEVRLWDAAAGTAVRALTGHTSWVRSASWSSDGSALATTGDDRAVRLWDPPTGKAVRTLTGHGSPILALATAPDGVTLATTHPDHTVRLWDLRTGATTESLTGHTGSVFAVSWAPGGRRLATAGTDNSVILWDPALGIEVRLGLRPRGSVRTLAWSPDGDLLATAGTDNAVRLWDPLTGATRGTLTGHTGSVQALAWSPDGGSLATAGTDRTVRLWDPRTGDNTSTIAGHAGSVRALAWSPDGTMIATADTDATVRLSTPATGTVTVYPSVVHALAWAPDGTALGTAGADGSVRLLDPASGAVRTLTGHAGAVRALAWTPDGATLVTGGTDGTVRLWDPAHGAELATLLPLADGGWAAFGDGWQKVVGQPRGEFWYAIGLCRFEFGELPDERQVSQVVPADTPLADLGGRPAG